MKKEKQPDLLVKTKLIESQCAACGIKFAYQDSFGAMIVDRGYQFYCPAGHSLEERDKADARREKVRLEREKSLQDQKAVEEKEKAEKDAKRRNGFWFKLFN